MFKAHQNVLLISVSKAIPRTDVRTSLMRSFFYWNPKKNHFEYQRPIYQARLKLHVLKQHLERCFVTYCCDKGY